MFILFILNQKENTRENTHRCNWDKGDMIYRSLYGLNMQCHMTFKKLQSGYRIFDNLTSDAMFVLVTELWKSHNFWIIYNIKHGGFK